MLNWIVRNGTVRPFNCMWTNDWCLIVTVISQYLKQYTMCKQMINIR